MNFRIISIAILTILMSCTSKPHKSNSIEFELSKIMKSTSKSDLQNLEFNTFVVNWENPEKWESDCEYYIVTPRVDTFSNKYALDFCYNKFRWWNKYEKNQEDLYNKFEKCKDSILNQSSKNGSIEHIKSNFYKNTIKDKIYYLTCDNEGYISQYELQYEIDFESFQIFGEFAVDKDSVYHFYDSSNGRLILKLEEVDRNSFLSFGNSVYAKDKNHVFDSRHGIVDKADLKTFKVISKNFAKDKNHFYFWDEIIEDSTEINRLQKFSK